MVMRLRVMPWWIFNIVQECKKNTPPFSILPQNVLKGTTSINMREIDSSHVKETNCTCWLVTNGIQKAACSFRMFERSCLRQRRLFTFVHHYASREIIVLEKTGPGIWEIFKLTNKKPWGVKPPNPLDPLMSRPLYWRVGSLYDPISGHRYKYMPRGILPGVKGGFWFPWQRIRVLALQGPLGRWRKRSSAKHWLSRRRVKHARPPRSVRAIFVYDDHGVFFQRRNWLDRCQKVSPRYAKITWNKFVQEKVVTRWYLFWQAIFWQGAQLVYFQNILAIFAGKFHTYLSEIYCTFNTKTHLWYDFWFSSWFVVSYLPPNGH